MSPVPRPTALHRISDPLVGSALSVVSTVLLLLILALTPTVIADERGQPEELQPETTAFLPELDDIRFFDDGAPELSEEELVREIYATYRDRMRASGYEFSVDLHGFRTVYGQDFDRQALLPLVTPHVGRILKVSANEMSLSRGHTPTLRYVLDWNSLPASDAGEPSKAKADGSTSVADLLDMVAVEWEERGDALALTSYAVTVELDGQARSYRAATFWYASQTEGIDLRVVDNVVPSVAEIAADHSPVTSIETVDQLQRHAFDIRPPASGRVASRAGRGSEKSSCSESSSEGTGDEVAVRDATRHLTGFHRFVAYMDVQCSCSDTCVTRCAPSAVATCSDHGLPDGPFTHRTYEKTRQESKVSTDSFVPCSADVVCAVESCPLDICGGVTISWGGAGFTVGASAIWSHSERLAGYCQDVCQPVVEEPEAPGGPGDDDDTDSCDGLGCSDGGGASGGDAGPFGGTIGTIGGGGSIGVGSGSSFPVYCDGDFAGTAETMDEAVEMCEEPSGGDGGPCAEN